MMVIIECYHLISWLWLHLLCYSRWRVGISGTTSTSKVHGDGNKSTEVKSSSSTCTELYYWTNMFGPVAVIRAMYSVTTSPWRQLPNFVSKPTFFGCQKDMFHLVADIFFTPSPLHISWCIKVEWFFNLANNLRKLHLGVQELHQPARGNVMWLKMTIVLLCLVEAAKISEEISGWEQLIFHNCSSTTSCSIVK